MKAWTAVTIGVADMDAALSLWVGEFGFNVCAERDGPDYGMSDRWGLSASDIRRQALVRNGVAASGMLHFVEFAEPAPPVRSGAESFDLCPKNLDIYTRDMPSRMRALRKAGHEFRNEEYSEITAPSGITFREIHMPSHDCINVVLLELIGADLPYSARDFAGVGPLITIVPDADRESAFYREVFDLECLSRNRLDGPDIEKMIGLPAGAALEVSIWGDPAEPLGQIEIIEYRGVTGRNLYPRARAPATGILELCYSAADAGPIRERFRAADIPIVQHDRIDALVAKGSMLTAHSPAGFSINVIETA